jgi:hypothetical protein
MSQTPIMTLNEKPDIHMKVWNINADTSRTLLERLKYSEKYKGWRKTYEEN